MSIDREPCEGAGYHAPAPLWTERHHVYPKYLCGLLAIADRPELVALCPNCHGRVHHALTHRINTGANPHRLSPAEAALVAAAWAWWVAELQEPTDGTT